MVAAWLIRKGKERRRMALVCSSAKLELGVGTVENKTGYAQRRKNKRLTRERTEQDVKYVYV